MAWLASRHRAAASAVRIGIGDDMAMVQSSGAARSLGGAVLVTADMLMDGVDFETAVHPPELIGRKAMAASLSDCAAMAVRPRFALASVALPRTWSMRDARRLYSGLEALGRAYDCELIGGDTNSWRHPLVIDVMILAEPWPGILPVRRGGVRVGDIICVTGQLGGSLWAGKSRNAKTPKRRHAREVRGQGTPRHLVFEPRVREAHWLAARLGNGLHAMMDLSDGLSTDAARMARASSCGIEFCEEAVKVVASPAAKAASGEDHRNILDHVLNDGEDFELLFAVAPRALRRLKNAADRAGPRFKAGFCEPGVLRDGAGVRRGKVGVRAEQPRWTAIGVAVGGDGVWLRHAGGKRERVPPAGYQHSIGP